MEKVYYLDAYEIEETKKMLEDNPHSNGWARMWLIGEENTCYPELDEYFFSVGLKKGDKVLIHSEW